MIRPASCRRERGLTLVELLVALTLLAMVSLLMMTGLRLGSRVWERVEGASQELDATLGVHGFLRARLSGTSRPDAVAGTAERLRFSAPWMTALGGAGIYGFELARREDELVLAWRPVEELVGSGQSAVAEAVSGERVLLERITGLRISYFGRPKGADRPRWVERWAAEWGARPW